VNALRAKRHRLPSLRTLRALRWIFFLASCNTARPRMATTE
jgi:hypothetical protein